MIRHHCWPVPCILFALACAPGAQTPLTTVRVASGFGKPVVVTAPPGDHHRLFVAEQYGGIYVIVDGIVQSTPFLDLTDIVEPRGEEGLLGFAFHPDFADNGFFFVNYTLDSSGNTRVERYTVSANNPNRADRQSARQILTVPQPRGEHNGGCLAFGPHDGYLYVSLGDGGGGGDPGCVAQSGTSLLGKILRIDVDTGSPYSSPFTNPFFTNPAYRNEIWTYGWRNPWRFSFDRATGDMYVGDVGEGDREEISFTAGQGGGGENYGWKLMEGSLCFGTSGCSPSIWCNHPSIEPPIHEVVNGSGNCSITGGYVYRGCAIPDLVGSYFFGDFCSGKVWSLRYDGQSVTQLTDRTNELRPNAGVIDAISTFGEDACGEIYIVNYVSGDIFKIVAAVPGPATNLGFGKVGSNGKTPAFEVCGLLGPGLTATATLRDAPPNAPAALLLSAGQSPVTVWFGTIVPAAPIEPIPFTTDGDGEVSFTLWGGGGPSTGIAQWAVLDAGVSASVGLSNALRVDFP